ALRAWAAIPLIAAGVLVPGASAQAAAPCQEIGPAMPDGVRLDGWFRPAAGGGKAPVLWTMTPYTNDACPEHIAGIDDALAAKFNLVRLSYRGDGASEGVSDQWGPQTRKDVLDVGDWIA